MTYFIGFLIYEVIGLVLIFAVSCVTVNRIIARYGIDVMDKLNDWMNGQFKAYCGGDKTCFAMALIIGMLVWPIRLAQAFDTICVMWARAEYEYNAKKPLNQKEES